MAIDAQTPQKEDVSVTLDLSQEELAVLLRALGIARLPGFVVSEGFNDAHAEAALNSLRARSLAVVGESKQLRILPAAEALVHAGGYATRVLSIVRQARAHQSIRSWYYMAPDITVFHNEFDYAVHHFQSIPNGMSFLATLSMAMGIDPLQESKVPQARFSLEMTVWQQLNELLKHDQSSQAHALLARYDFPVEFADAVIEADLRNAVSLIQPDAQSAISTKGMLLLTHNDVNWLLVFKPHVIDVSAVTNTTALESVASLITGD